MHIQADSLAEGSIYQAGHLIHGCGLELHSHITKVISDITGFWDASKDPFKFLMREVIDDVWKQSFSVVFLEHLVPTMQQYQTQSLCNYIKLNKS